MTLLLLLTDTNFSSNPNIANLVNKLVLFPQVFQISYVKLYIQQLGINIFCWSKYKKRAHAYGSGFILTVSIFILKTSVLVMSCSNFIHSHIKIKLLVPTVVVDEVACSFTLTMFSYK